MTSAGNTGFFLHEELKAIVINSIDVEIRNGHFLVMCIIILEVRCNAEENPSILI
jgi:hypothetical protein